MTGRIALVGECYGAEERVAERPFVGASGKELDRQLAEVGIDRAACWLTNVVNEQPPRNDFAHFCCRRKDLSPDYTLPPIEFSGASKLYLKPEYLPNLDRLRRELTAFAPDLVVALGGKANWALTERCEIEPLRGYLAFSNLVPGMAVLPTWHPAAILRSYSDRHTTILDLRKALALSRSGPLARPSRRVHLPESPADIAAFAEAYIDGAPRLSFDIETSRGQVTCISFAPTPDDILVVPFVDYRASGCNYWPSLAAELDAWVEVRAILASPIPKVGQNAGLYDTLFLLQQHGIRVNNFAEDTMLLHHSLQPEAEKSLAYLGSLYGHPCEAAWKAAKPKGQMTPKRDE